MKVAFFLRSDKTDWFMKLRDHPLITYRGYPMWPPIWVGISTRGKSPPGEIGRLKQVRSYPDKPRRIFLTMENDGAQYTGCLLFDDQVYCERIAELLRGCYDMLIKAVGDLDIPLPFDLVSTYRKACDCQTWHCCNNCSHWPTENFVEEITLPTAVTLCNECKSLQLELKCRS